MKKTITMKRIVLVCLLISNALNVYYQKKPVSPYLRIRVMDLDKEVGRQVVVDWEDGQYLGHPTTVLLDDDKTILVVYPKGHGQGEIVY